MIPADHKETCFKNLRLSIFPLSLGSAKDRKVYNLCVFNPLQD